jgi:predicted MFS family arabinose efflux permease
MGDVRTSLANRRFTAYLLTAALADIGYWIAYVAQGWLVLKLTNSPFWLGTVGAASNVPFLVFSLPGGALADRFNRSALVALASAAISLVALVLAVLAQRGAITIGLLVALTFLLGTLFALSAPIDRAWMYDLVEGRGIGTATALSSLEWSVARTLGPALGGVATATIGVAAGYAALGALALPLMLLALTLARVERTRHSPCISPGEPLAPKAADERRIVAMSLLVAAFTASVIPYISFLPDIARNTLRLDARGYGLLAACGGIGSILGAMMISALGELEHKGRLVPMIVTGGAVLLALFTILRAVPAVALVLVLMGGIDTAAWTLSNTYVQECASDERRGRANAIMLLAFGGGIPIGNLVLGTIAGRYGSLVALQFSAGVACAAAALFWFGARQARDAA